MRWACGISKLSREFINQPAPADHLFPPAKIKNIDTKGKLLWFELENSLKEPVWLLCNFGLTGEWGFTMKNNARLKFKIIIKN